MRYYKFIILCLVFIFVSIILSLFLSSDYTFLDVLKVIFTDKMDGTTLSTIVFKVRIPRILLSLIIGAALSVSGVVFQGMLRNSLAEPYTLGVSGGASLGVCIAQVLSLSFIFFPVFAFIGALISILFIYLLFIRGNFSVYKIILAGIMISLITSSLVFLIFAISDSRDIQAIVMWLMGNISSVKYSYVLLIYFLLIPGILYLIYMARDIDILTLGEEKAFELGVNIRVSAKVLFIVTSLIVGVCVAYVGVIGFVGLVIPHIVRGTIGSTHRKLMIGSSLLGAGYLCLADTVAKNVIYPLELPVGVITGILGGVFLIYIISVKKSFIPN